MEKKQGSTGKNIELVEGFRTGIVRAKYYNPNSTNINGEHIDITVVDCSSHYTSNKKTAERVIVINHSSVTISNQNDSA